MCSVTMLLAEALSSFHFKGDHFFTLHKCTDDFSFHGSFYITTYRDRSAVVYQLYVTELNLVTGITLQVRNVQTLTCLYFKLLTCDFYNC